MPAEAICPVSFSSLILPCMAANPDATWTQLLKISQGVIQSLHLVYGNSGTALPGSQVYIFKFPNDQFRLPTGSVAWPCVILAPGRLEDVDDPEQTFEDTIMIYPILVGLFFNTNQQLALNNDILYWRERIIEAFLDQPASLATVMDGNLTGVVEWDCRLDPAPLIDIDVFIRQNLDASMFHLTFRTSRDRGRL